MICFFFFKQKTAYEMRISDWSSDVCSSDLTIDSCPGVSSRLKISPACSKVITDEVTEIQRCCSIFIQSERARRAAPRALTSPAIWFAPPATSNFSVSVVLPATGCDMMAKVRRSGSDEGRVGYEGARTCS